MNKNSSINSIGKTEGEIGSKVRIEQERKCNPISES